MKIIGISGKRGTGKSLLAKALIPFGYERISLARALKDQVKREFGLIEEQVNGCLKESPTQYRRTDGNFLTPRDIMIRCGVYYRSIDPLYWCKRVEESMAYIDRSRSFVIDDIRFLNEIKFFKERGATFARIERDDSLNVFKAALDDLSETELDTYKEWDYILIKELNRVPADLEKFAKYIDAHNGNVVNA